MCDSTVRTESDSLSAMSALLRPWATSRAVSRSRAVSGESRIAVTSGSPLAPACLRLAGGERLGTAPSVAAPGRQRDRRLSGCLGGVDARLDRGVPLGDCHQLGGVALARGDGLARPQLGQRRIGAVGDLAQPVGHPLRGAAHPDVQVQQFGLDQHRLARLRRGFERNRLGAGEIRLGCEHQRFGQREAGARGRVYRRPTERLEPPIERVAGRLGAPREGVGLGDPGVGHWGHGARIGERESGERVLGVAAGGSSSPNGSPRRT